MDFDSNFTVYSFTSFLNEVFNIQTPIVITTETNELLSPNLRLVELILLNPLKYKKMKIIKQPNDLVITPSSYQQKMTLEDNPKISYDIDSNNHNNPLITKTDECETNKAPLNFYCPSNRKTQVIPIDSQDEMINYTNQINSSDEDNHHHQYAEGIKTNIITGHWDKNNKYSPSIVKLNNMYQLENQSSRTNHETMRHEFNFDYKQGSGLLKDNDYLIRGNKISNSSDPCKNVNYIHRNKNN